MWSLGTAFLVPLGALYRPTYGFTMRLVRLRFDHVLSCAEVKARCADRLIGASLVSICSLPLDAQGGLTRRCLS